MVGTKCIDFTDETRKDELSKNNENRRLKVRFYYPGVDEEGKEPLKILTVDKIGNFGKNLDFSTYDQLVKIYDVEMEKGPFPLVLFSHGYSGCAEQNTYLCKYLAEHGYIVASISHTYEESITDFEDGSVIKFDKKLIWKIMNPLNLLDQARLLKNTRLSDEEALKKFDIHQEKYEKFMVGRIAEWNKDDLCAIKKIHELAEDKDSFLYHKIDFSNGIGATGHSFGGDTAYFHCLYDDEVSCGVNMDGGLFGFFGDTVNHKPFMQILNKGNKTVVTRSRIYHDAPVHYMVFRDMKHLGFSDLKFLTNKASSVGQADTNLVMDTLNEAHLAFFDRYLKNADKENRTELDINKEALEEYEVL